MKTVTVFAAALLLAGCGGSDSGSEHENTDPKVALAEIDKTREGLDAALAKYREGGDARAAADAVGDVYLDHFEKVEEPLAKVDAELKEHLEEAISTELRAHMKAGRTVSAIAKEIAAIERDLDKAQAKLK